MSKLNFKIFLENEEDEMAKNVAKSWKDVKIDVSNLFNRNEAINITIAITSKEPNAMALTYLFLENSSDSLIEVYDKKIVGNLLKKSNYEKEVNIVLAGIVASKNLLKQCETSFRILEPEKNSYMHLINPPLSYSGKDKTIVLGIISHEAQHVLDFLNNEIRKEDVVEAKIDLEGYYNSIIESRAYIVQIKTIMREIISLAPQLSHKELIEVTLNLLTGSDNKYHEMPDFGKKVMINFMKEIEKNKNFLNENINNNESKLLKEEITKDIKDMVNQEKRKYLEEKLKSLVKNFCYHIDKKYKFENFYKKSN